MQFDLSQWMEKAGLKNFRLRMRDGGGEGLARTVAGSLTGVVVIAVLLSLLLGWWWTIEPDLFDVREHARVHAEENAQRVVVGYVILFSSTKTEGTIQIFGRGLSIWVFIIAAFFPVMGAYVTLAGLCPMEDMIQSMQSMQSG